MSQARKLRSGRRVPYLDGVKKAPRTKRSSPSKQKPVNAPSLCFHGAFVRFSNNDITEEGYLQAILAHCNGTRHGSNRLCNNDELPGAGFVKSGFADNLRNVDDFTPRIANWIKKDVCKNDTRTIRNTTPIFNVLQAYRSDDVAAFNAGLEEMDSAYEALGDSPSLSQSLCRELATLIVRRQSDKVEILRATLNKYHTNMSFDFEIGYQHCRKDKNCPELCQVVKDSGYKSGAPKRASGKKALELLMGEIMFGGA